MVRLYSAMQTRRSRQSVYVTATLAAAGFVLLVATPVAASEGGTQIAIPDPLPLAWCLERADRSNPSLEAVAAAAAEAGARVSIAGALEDPRLGYEASNLPVSDWNFRSTPLSGHQLRLSQRLPFPGVLRNREAAARSGARASDLEVDDQHRSVAAAVEMAWAELGFAQRANDITLRNLDLLRGLARIAEARYRVGSGLQQDVLRAQVELTSLLDEHLKREAAIQRAEGRLAALLDLPVGARLPRTAALADAAPIPELEFVLARLPESNPSLLALEERVAQHESESRAAELRGLPDMDVAVGYRIRKDVVGDPVKGNDFFSAGVTLRLPVNRKRWNAEAAEKGARARRARAEHRMALLQLSEMARSAWSDLVRADREADLMAGGLIPQARQSLDSSRSGYQVGRVGFLDLLDSQVHLLRAELREVRATADRRAAYAALEQAVGRELR